MILTNCAACAAPLAHDAPKCGRCQIRYCGPTCQQDHWRRGHKQICKQIHRGGNAEQYHADKKYKEAVEEAVEACAEDTAGQTCYICMEGVKRSTGEGLVSGFCSCRGDTAFAHVSCLARLSQTVVDDEQLASVSVKTRFARWWKCQQCGQDFHGVVKCALGWACWKTYANRPETDWCVTASMTELGNGLAGVDKHAEALAIDEAALAMTLRVFPDKHGDISCILNNIARRQHFLGRDDLALVRLREVHDRESDFWGNDHVITLGAALNVATALVDMERFAEVIPFARAQAALAQRALGPEDDTSISLGAVAAVTLYMNDAATDDDLRAAMARLEALQQIARRSRGDAHPEAKLFEFELARARAKLAARATVLRFRVGTPVECNRGRTWPRGRIVRLHYWESGFPPEFFAPYQIELDDGELIYAPEDSDDYLRAVSLVDSLSAEFDHALVEIGRPFNYWLELAQALEFLVQAFQIALAEFANFLGLHPTNVPHAPPQQQEAPRGRRRRRRRRQRRD